MPMPGKLALISQSGAIGSAILDLSAKEGIGFRYFVSVGSMLDVDFGDLIGYLGNDPQVSSIVLYVENLTGVRKFMTAARAVSRIKPIVALKAGKSRAGAREVFSHIGAMSGEDEVYEAAFKRAGIVRVDTIEELFDCAELMAKQRPPTGSGVAVLTNGGGPGVMAADALSEQGLEPVMLSSETVQDLDEFLPRSWSRANPIDILADASPDRWRRAMEVCLSALEIKALIVIFVPQTLSDGSAVARAVIELLHKRRHPSVFAVWMGGDSVEEGRRILSSAGIPTYETPERAVSAFIHMYTHMRNLEMLQEIPPKLPRSLIFDQSGAREMISKALNEGTGFLTEVESKALLESYGISTNRTAVAATADEAADLAREIGYPVAMKVLSRGIANKSDAGGVQLNLRSEKDVRHAFGEIQATVGASVPDADIMGVTIQAMITPVEYELVLGSKTEVNFGPVIFFGMGGFMTEILKDRGIALPPLNRLLARRLMETTRVYQVLKGYRNRPPANLDLLEEILTRLSQLATDFPEISELEINPLILAGDQALAVDARAMVKPSRIPSPHHLVISPYPNQYEKRITTKAGLKLFIRPIRPEDAQLLLDLFQVLSWQSIYYRFFGPLKSVPLDMLARFTQIDYDRDMALVAIDDSLPEEKIMGVARVMGRPDGKSAEVAIVVGDPWHGKGVGATLLRRLMVVAKERGMPSLWGTVLAENTQMLALARKMGFKVSRIPGENQYEIEMDLRSMTADESL